MTLDKTARVRDRHAEAGGPLHLLVMGVDVFETHALPSGGRIVIGRDPSEAQIVLLDPLASRKHVSLELGEHVLVEDLGSANGTWLRDERLPPGKPMRVFAGEAIRVGGMVLMVQRSRPRIEAPRVWPHGHIESVMADLAARGAEAAFSLARIQIEEPITPARFAATLVPVLEVQDMLAVYAPGDFSVLLPGRRAEAAAAFVERALEVCRRAELTANAAAVSHPDDCRGAEAVLERVNDRINGLAPAEGERVVYSDSMRSLYELATRAASSAINILIQGETGVGKEVLARQIHARSPRASRRLVTFNCAALAESLVDSELFGHARGAFTGATDDRPGLLELADGGTVFLDEVGELSPLTQAKLLRAIEQKEIQAVGSRETKPIDVRFVSATNRNLEEEVAGKRFRADLYFRLTGMTLTVPPLRERQEDIVPLAQHFIVQSSTARGWRERVRLSDAAAGWLVRYAWPGNVRELRNVIERALILCDGDEIEPEHLPLDKMLGEPSVAATDVADLSPVDRERRRHIIAVLEECVGNQTRAAEKLGMRRKTLMALLDRYQIPRPRKR